MRLIPFLFLILTLLQPLKAVAQIYADVTVGGSVTGTFTITLEHVKAPVTVASFIGLATGQHGWLDINTGAIRYDGFYNGVAFHRIVKDFVSQVGSRKGDGTDGPGYAFRNEIDSTLHHNAYTVAMANSGKHTNGSQFYVTDGAQLFLDGNYTIFGTVTAGQSICDQINNVPVDANSKPLSAVSITSINIYGPSLAAFNLNPPGLPRLFNSLPTLKKNGTAYSLDYDHQPYSEYTLYHSSDLVTWARLASGYFGTFASVGDIDLTASATGLRHFYRMARVDYSLCSPLLTGSTLHFSSPSSTSPLAGTAVLNAARTGGTWIPDSGSSLAITTATFSTQPYTGNFYMQWSNGQQFQLTLQSDTSTSGNYTGQTSVSGFSTVSGTFTVAP